jgi:putative AdoMet-dependent methyltransferase
LRINWVLANCQCAQRGLIGIKARDFQLRKGLGSWRKLDAHHEFLYSQNPMRSISLFRISRQSWKQRVVRIVVFCFGKGADVSLYSSQFFDTFIHQYDESRFPFSGRGEIFQSQMREIECRQACSVLDLGCGEGEFLRSVVQRFPTVRAVGVDFSQQALSVARGAEPRVNWVCANMDGSLPVGTDRFDVILSAYVLHHWDDATKASLLVNLVHNHLAPGGVVLMGDIGFASKEQADRTRLLNADLWDESEHYFVFESLKPLLDAVELVSELRILSNCCALLVVRK